MLRTPCWPMLFLLLLAPARADDGSFSAQQAALRRRLALPDRGDRARNVILFIGDGMGPSTVTAARIYAGQRAGVDGESTPLSFELLPHAALARTYNTDAQVPDSAGTMSAIATGAKTRMGVLSVDASVPRGDCAAALASPPPDTLLERAEAAGLRTGLVSTARITHATPAALYAHSAERGWEDDTDLPAEARAAGCIDIAAQLLAPRAGDGPDVVLGGGRRHFLPASSPPGARQDGRDLVAEWQAARPGAPYVTTAAQLAALPDEATAVLGLFAPSHLPMDLERAADDPSLADMTRAALAVLQRGSGSGGGGGEAPGFFLMVEGGRIDHAHHRGAAGPALAETAAFAEAVAAAQALTDPAETLIIVTADHSHTLTISGYPRRGNDILGVVRDVDGEVSLGRDGQPYTTLGYANGPGAGSGTDGVRPAPEEGMAARQQALVPLGSETHGGEDVGVYASGPGAHLIGGAVEQSYLFHVMVYALRLAPTSP